MNESESIQWKKHKNTEKMKILNEKKNYKILNEINIRGKKNKLNIHKIDLWTFFPILFAFFFSKQKKSLKNYIFYFLWMIQWMENMILRWFEVFLFYSFDSILLCFVFGLSHLMLFHMTFSLCQNCIMSELYYCHLKMFAPPLFFESNLFLLLFHFLEFNFSSICSKIVVNVRLERFESEHFSHWIYQFYRCWQFTNKFHLFSSFRFHHHHLLIYIQLNYSFYRFQFIQNVNKLKSYFRFIIEIVNFGFLKTKITQWHNHVHKSKSCWRLFIHLIGCMHLKSYL